MSYSSERTFGRVFKAGDDSSGHEPDAFFSADENGIYRDIAKEMGLIEPHVSRGIAIGDVDDDGDLDFAVARQWQAPAIYINQSKNDNISLILDLRLLNTNGTTRAAIGAFAEIETPDGRRQIGFSDASNSRARKRSSHIHFGLGQLRVTDPIAVTLSWRDAAGPHKQRLTLSGGKHRITLVGQPDDHCCNQDLEN